MEFKININYFSKFFLSLLISQTILSGPTCIIKLTCEKQCNNLFRLIKGESSNTNTISLTTDNIEYDAHDISYILNTQYKPTDSFSCEPGDKITFIVEHKVEITNTAIVENGLFKVGFIASLIIKDINNEEVTYNSFDEANNIFSCNPSCTLSTSDSIDTLNFTGDSQQYKALGAYNYEQISVTISIPYQINDIENQIFYNITSIKTFEFKNFITPKISGADLNRIKVKITPITSIDKFNLYKNSIPLGTDESISLTNEIKFEPVEDNYGLFQINYKVIVMDVELSETYSIKFHVCYKYCQDCDQYDSLNSASKKCTSCKTDSTFLIENEDNDRCFSSEEINENFTRYYLDNSASPQKYKKCAINFCDTCRGHSENCTKCIDLYYYVEGKPDSSEYPHKCYSQNEIIDNFKYYYLENSPTGDKYYLCQDPCKTCRLNKDNCFTCVDNKYFYSDNLTICQDDRLDPKFFKIDNTFLLKDSSCNSIKDNKNKKICDECSSGYFKNFTSDFCYLKYEIFSKFGLNKFKNSEDKYDTCNEECVTCSSKEYCLNCSTGYYFLEGPGPDDGKCKKPNLINTDEYYLPEGSDTYLKCNDNCKCKYRKDYCIGCKIGTYFDKDENTCRDNNEKYGYYLDNDDLTFYKCDNSCLTCNGKGPDKCITCAEPYHLINMGDNINRCITQIEKKNNPTYDKYFLKDNTNYEKCADSCLKCEDGTDNNICIECAGGYYFYEGDMRHCETKEGFFNGNAHENYYFNTKLGEFRLCHSSCKSCKEGEVYNNCSVCNTDYVFVDDQSYGKCVLESIFLNTLKNYYYIDEININTRLRALTTETAKVYKKCPENCDECSSFQESPLRCKICNQDKGYYKHTLTMINSATEDCYDNSIIPYYYFAGNEYSKTQDNCLTSTYETFTKGSCLECHNKLGYYSLEHAQETCQNTIPVDHYVTSDNIIKKCPYECASCSEGPKSNSTNCDVCKEEFPPSPSNPKNCIFQCQFYQYKYYDNKYCTGEKECPDLVPYLIKENSTCVTKCEKVSYYGVCLEECPPGTSNSAGKCIESGCTLSTFEEIREHLVDLKNDITPVSKKVKKYKKYFDYTSSHVDMYTHYLNEYIMLIYQKSDCIHELLPDLVSVNFKDCDYIEKDNIIVLFLVPRENKYSKIYYQLFEIISLPNTINPIDKFSCNKVKIEIPASQANFDIDKYQQFDQKQIDLTNPYEDFFHNMCFQNYEDGKDIVIEQRRKEYYQDKYKICIDNCNWNTPDYNYKRAVCVCDTNYQYLEDLNKDYIDQNKYRVTTDEFYNTDTYIFEHFKCFKYNFERGNIFENMGSYIMIVFFLFEIISVIIYCVFGIDSVKMYIIDFVRRNPPKKIKITDAGSEEELYNNENDIENEIENNNIEIKSISVNKNTSYNLMDDNSSTRRNKKKIINILVEKEKQNKSMKNNKKIKKWEQPDLLIGRSNNLGFSNINNKEVKIYERYTKKENIEEIQEENDKITDKENNKNKRSVLFSSKIILKQSTDKKNDFKKHSHVFNDFELNSMELYDAIIKDKRSFCEFYKLQMKAKQEFYRAFCFNEPLYPISIKIIIYIFNLSLSLVFNALLYTEDQIYEGIKSMGKNIGNIFLRSFYTFLIIKVIDYLVNLLIKNANYLRSLVLRRRREKEIRVDAYKSLKHVQANFALFIIFVIICDILFWIFITSYCYCYNGEQWELFGSLLVTQFYIEIYCVFFGLYLAVCRFIGLKYKATTFYKMSQTFLDN